ncbi:acyl-CoA dehydrogenase family protein [Kibdelosporangium lantanae]
MLTKQSAPATGLVDRVSGLLPVLRSHSEWVEQNRRIHDESLEKLAEAGVFRMRVPTRYGGYETDATTMLDVISEVARGDGSTAWTTAVWAISGWLACMFPDHVQDEVFSTPDVRVCGVLSPTAAAVPTDGGMVVNGQWRFMSGALHSHWQVVIAMGPAPDGSQWPVMAMVPMSDLRIVDDWYTSGLKGTGSVTTIAENVFVPGDRVLPLVAVLAGQHASQTNATAPIYHTPMVPSGCATFSGVAIGLARAAMASFMERLPDRKITYTDYAHQADAPVTHLNVAEAAMKIDEAEFHATRLATKVDTKNAAAEPWSTVDRVGARAALGRVFRLTKEAVQILGGASGGSSIYLDVPIQRINRDIETLNMHALMHATTNQELYGRVLCGLEPNTLYL